MSKSKHVRGHASRGDRSAATGGAVFLLLSCLTMTASAQTILFTEDFEDNVNRSFTTIGEGICQGNEPVQDPACPNGLGFFAHNFDVEATGNFIGAPILTGARAGQMLWNGDLNPDPVVNNVEPMLDVLEGMVRWLTSESDPSTTTIRWLTGLTDPNDATLPLETLPTNVEMISRLEAAGYTVNQELLRAETANIIPIDPLVSDVDIFSDTVFAGGSGRWIGAPVPLLNLRARNGGALNLSGPDTGLLDNGSSGLLPWTVTLTDVGEGHPAAGSQTGTFIWAQTAAGGYPGNIHGIGANVAPGGQILATWELPQKRLLANLAEAQGLIAGNLNSGFEILGQTINAADFRQAGSNNDFVEGRWFPGDPPGLGDQVLNHSIPGLSTDDSYAIHTTGTLNVSPGTPQTFSFAMSKAEKADGGKLVIDGTTVIEDDGNSVLDSFGTI